MTSRRLVGLVALDVLVWAVAIWLLTAKPDDHLGVRAAHHAARASWTLARFFGRRAIEAEVIYWELVNR